MARNETYGLHGSEQYDACGVKIRVSESKIGALQHFFAALTVRRVIIFVLLSFEDVNGLKTTKKYKDKTGIEPVTPGFAIPCSTTELLVPVGFSAMVTLTIMVCE